MLFHRSHRQEIRKLAGLSLSLGLIQVGYHLMGLVDTALAGRVGGETLAATGLGAGLYFTVSVLGIGIMLGLDPLIAQAFGAGQTHRARTVLWQGSFAAVLVSMPLSLLILLVGHELPRFGIAPSLAAPTYDYLIARLPSLWFLLFSVAIRAYLQAQHRTLPIVAAVVLFNILNFVMAWVLLFGDAGLVPLGLPALGLESQGVSGLAWASSIATVGQALFMILAVRTPGGTVVPSAWRVEQQTIRQVLSIGVPIGLQLTAETGVFALVGVLMGRMGPEIMGAHQVALQLASMTYAFTLGIGTATSVQVGRAVGRGDVPGTRFAGLAGVALGIVFMLSMAVIMGTSSASLARLMTSDPQVIPLAAHLVSIAAIFQVADGVQSVSAGALRGAGVTRFTFVVNLLGHWLLGAPLGLFLAFGLGLGARGLWWGLTAGLAAVALALVLRFAHLSGRSIARLEDPATVFRSFAKQ